jgi:Flp pilus assembly protein TadG
MLRFLPIRRGNGSTLNSWAPKRLLKSEDGQAMVELAFVLPVLMLILLAIFDFGQAVNTQNTSNHLANLGARFAAVGTMKTGAELCSYITSTAEPSNLKGKLGITITEPSVTVGSPVTVRVATTYNWLPFLQGAVGAIASPVSGEATMRVENTVNGSMECSIPTP